jgi:ABC-type transport system involved in cytochrome c biogenesis permease subunit
VASANPSSLWRARAVSSHELNSTLLYVHPPLAIAGYAFIFAFTALLFLTRRREAKTTKFFGVAAWVFTLLGLVTGMVWAQVAWGTYWSWDPKETLTLVLFVAVSASLALFYEKNWRTAKLAWLVSCVLSVVTASSSFLIAGLHSFI